MNIKFGIIFAFYTMFLVLSNALDILIEFLFLELYLSSSENV